METKTPLKRSPLNNPGDSVQNELLDLVYEGLVPYLWAVGLFTALALLEWYHLLTGAPPSPVSMTVLALVASLLAARKYYKTRKKAAALRQGRDGEKAVGQLLESLRETGAAVFHDVPGYGFNIDHIVVHQSEVYVIETKTWSKPAKGSPRLFFDGESINCPGLFATSAPVIQVMAGKGWINDLLLKETGREFPVKSVLLFPGWFIESNAPSDIWVLNPKALPKYIANAKPIIKPVDVKLCESRLSSFIRGAVNR